MQTVSAPAGLRVAVVEDDRWLCRHLRDEIGRAPGFACLAGYHSAEEALAALPALAPDVVVLDIHLPGLDGIECLRRLKPLCPATRFLILTAYEESDKIFQALLAGAHGYLLKGSETPELLDALRQVHAGGAPMSIPVARLVVQHFHHLGAGAAAGERLTPREQGVLEALARGAAYKEVADTLALSLDTVRWHIKHIYAKLHVHSRGAAVAAYRGQP